MRHILILSKVDVVDTLVPALELEPEVAVEDCLDERDIALNCLNLTHHHGPSVQKTDSCHLVKEVYSDSGGTTSGCSPSLLIPYRWFIWLRSSLRAFGVQT